VRATQAVTERALGLAEVVADTVIGPTRPAGASSSGSPSVDLDGEVIDDAHTPVPTPPPPTPPPPPEPAPPHIFTEADVVAENADPGAEDGAGAEVHVAEPWDGYRQLHAADVADRIIGADPAALAAVELYELSSRRRQTVLDAVARELERTQAGDQ
jgi:hypothetical protein